MLGDILFWLGMAGIGESGWYQAFVRNIIPAGIGNVLGASLLVALPFWFAFLQRSANV